MVKQYFLCYSTQGKSIVLFLYGGLANSFTHFFMPSLCLNFTHIILSIMTKEGSYGKTQLANNSKPDSMRLEILLEDLRYGIQYVQDK